MKYAYGISPSIFGNILVAFSSKGVGALYPAFDKGSDHDHIWNHLYIERIWKDHQLVEGGGSEKVAAERIVSTFVNNPAFERHSCELDIPNGTEFQRAVWNDLLTIKSGETKSYGEIAQSIGRDHVHRAVGTACGANPLIILIPCHRVVGTDPGRYRWGKEMKETLLQREKSK